MEQELIYDFSKFEKGDYKLDEDLLKKFKPIARKLRLSQESVEELFEIAFEMSEKQRAVYEKDESQKLSDDIEKYDRMFRDDDELPDLNTPKAKIYMKYANDAYSEFCSPKLKEFFEKTGLNYHPEIIKLFHKIGELSSLDGVNYSGKPAVENLTPAQILYGKYE
jgi:hypothetical protein